MRIIFLFFSAGISLHDDEWRRDEVGLDCWGGYSFVGTRTQIKNVQSERKNI